MIYLSHQKITTDTTEFKYYEEGAQKKLYLNPFLDLFNNEIISYTVSQRPTYQGWTYQLKTHFNTLKSHNSRKRDCYDNAVMENFFGLLKQEIYHGRIFNSFDEL